MDLTSTPHLILLANLARKHGFKITAGGAHRGHNIGSMHYQGRAIDVSVQGKTETQIHALQVEAIVEGFILRDERHKPPGPAVWTGPHLHIEDRHGMTGYPVRAA